MKIEKTELVPETRSVGLSFRVWMWEEFSYKSRFLGYIARDSAMAVLGWDLGLCIWISQVILLRETKHHTLKNFFLPDGYSGTPNIMLPTLFLLLKDRAGVSLFTYTAGQGWEILIVLQLLTKLDFLTFPCRPVLAQGRFVRLTYLI